MKRLSNWREKTPTPQNWTTSSFAREIPASANGTKSMIWLMRVFFLSHLSEPERCLAALARACRRGGAIVFEDIDFSGSFCYPHCAAYERYVELYQKIVQRRDGDANIGPKLPGLLRKAGAEGVQVNVVQPTHVQDEGKLMASITMERISGSVVSEGLATEEEVDQIIKGLIAAAENVETVMSLPRIFQVWGKRV
jgi:hypothetical protein